MKSVHPLHEFMPYGAPDLIVAQRPYLSRALAVSSTTALGIWLAFCAIVPGLAPSVDLEVPLPSIPKFEPKNFDPVAEPRIAPIPRIAFRPKSGMFVPAPEAPPASIAEIPNVGETGNKTSDATWSFDPTAEGNLPAPPAIDPDAPAIYVDELPYALNKVMPEYPEIAKQAMVDGKVLVLVLVGRDGRVHDAKVDEHQHSPLLDAAALEAARRWIFSPATVNGHPVAVWTAVPFRFVLSEASVR